MSADPSTTPALPTPPAGAALPGGALRLADWGVIRARGDDARSFLQGQLTQDVKGLLPGQARLAGWCSAKGRLLASFVMWSPAPDQVLLACSADVLAPTLKRLAMFVLRAKCKLDDASADLPLWGLAGESAAAWLGAGAGAGVNAVTEAQGGVLLRLADAALQAGPVPRWLWVAPQADAVPAPAPLDAGLWAGLEAAAAVPRIVAATAEQFVPQMVNLEVVGGVNFQKGCYPGQEVVARSQYRGTIKRRAVLLAGAAAMAPGQEVFHSDDPEQPAGRVVLAGRDPEAKATGCLALVELKTAALDSGRLHLGAADGPVLQPRPLPYAFPTDAA